MPQTGATRYQKFLKSEKAKTKLKAKKDLPKGTNVTKTNFKVKKIVLKEQLKRHSEYEALSNRKLSVNELLNRLNHFNVNSRTDALSGVKELVTSHPDVLNSSLGQLINGISPLVLNIEQVVRRETFKVLHLILSIANIEKIEPFYDIMSTYLRSAMTHIDNRIQEDSLLFLDILLICTPDKIANDFHKIIPNFLDMISKLRLDSKPGRTLTVNLDRDITTTKWRVKVLHRLNDYLTKFIQSKNIDSRDRSAKGSTHTFDTGKVNNYSLFNPNSISVCTLPCFSSKVQNLHNIPDEVEKFKNYAETLMPLLFDTWLEVCPNMNRENNIETVVNEDAAGLLKHTLNVIALLWKLIQNIDRENPSANLVAFFTQKYRQPFTQNIFQSFPYVTRLKTRSANLSAFENFLTDPKLMLENLEICRLFINFNPNFNMKTQVKDVTTLLLYVENAFNPKLDEDINKAVVEILQTIFSNNVTNWTKNLIIMNSIFKKIITSYFNEDLANEFRQKLFSILCQIALNHKLRHFHSCEDFSQWLLKLPDILLKKTITLQILDILHKFAVRNNKVFNDIMKPKLTSIVENLPKIQLVNSVHDSSIFKLFSLLYFIKNWDNDSLNLLENQLLNNAYRGDHGKFIYETLTLKSGGIYQ